MRIALAAPSSALAHLTPATQAHWHASDVWGLLAIVTLTAGAVWLGRRDR